MKRLGEEGVKRTQWLEEPLHNLGSVDALTLGVITVEKFSAPVSYPLAQQILSNPSRRLSFAHFPGKKVTPNW